MGDDARLQRRPGFDADETAVIREMTRRSNVQDRAARAGLWGRAWEDGDWHPSCRGKAWPEYARAAFLIGQQMRAAERVEAIRARSARAALLEERRQAAQAKARRARRARQAWKFARWVAPSLTRRWRRVWVGDAQRPRSPRRQGPGPQAGRSAHQQ